MSKIMGGELLLRCLAKEGVRVVFGVPGGQLCPFLDAIGRLGPELGVEFVMTRHEQAAAHMADAYARVTGRPGVCLGTVGPGAADLVPGVYPAFADSIPMVVIAAQNQSWASYPDHGSAQALAQVPLFAPVTKWQALISHRQRIPELVQAAFRTTLAGRPAPVFLDVPADVMTAKGDLDELPLPPPERYRAQAPGAGDPGLVRGAARMLASAKAPLIHAGGGVLRAGASPELVALAEYLQAPVTTSVAGRGAIPEDHPLCLIPFGYGAIGGQAAADTVLVVGSRIGVLDFWGRPPSWGEPGSQAWIQVDAAPEMIGLNHEVDVGIVGDAKTVLRQLLQAVRRLVPRRSRPPDFLAEAVAAQDTWLAGFADWAGSDAIPMHPLRLIREVRRFFPRDAICAVDGGNSVCWAHYLNRTYQPRSFLQAVDSGHLGVGIPYAIGAKVAAPERPVYLITGDGSFLFNCQELETAARIRTPFVAIIVNDKQWGMIKGDFKSGYCERNVGTDFTDVRHDLLAQSMGCFGERVTEPDQVRPALERAVASGLPAVLDVMVDPCANVDLPDLPILEGLWMEGCEVS
jgi:acetolactate synthase I/II/III large subunit